MGSVVMIRKMEHSNQKVNWGQERAYQKSNKVLRNRKKKFGSDKVDSVEMLCHLWQ